MMHESAVGFGCSIVWASSAFNRGAPIAYVAAAPAAIVFRNERLDSSSNAWKSFMGSLCVFELQDEALRREMACVLQIVSWINGGLQCCRGFHFCGDLLQLHFGQCGYIGFRWLTCDRVDLHQLDAASRFQYLAQAFRKF